ncbi:exocyst complex component Sec10-domain-containing protein [Filobasidium floriforme]|uniref:exocyst complex component Sec10-domain-containing protein n=1 Tax=Filobasidium floriforme TaxID=5210 RepID=UPI001E8CE59C|nr:exocyst complex component Sec10-domain-containing protein [Filobasidium floriforme]KAH8079635.1 exocyst complex component Sec10-domain-containing protein [Filobasidium floriforme]
MWSSKKTAAAPTAIAGGPSSASSTGGRNTFSILQPTLVNNTSQGNFNSNSNSNFNVKGKNSNTNRELWIGRLPASLHRKVLSYLPVPDVPRYAAACKQLSGLVRNAEETWKVKCEVLGVSLGLDSISTAETSTSTGTGTSVSGRERQGGDEDEDGMTGFGLGISTTNTNGSGNGEGNRHRAQGSISNLKSMTNPAAAGKPGAFAFEDNDDEEDDFGDFSGSGTIPNSGQTKTTGLARRYSNSKSLNVNSQGIDIEVPSTFKTNIPGVATTGGAGHSKMKNSGTPNLMDFSDGFDDLDFDFGSVPMPSNSAKSPEKSRGRGTAGHLQKSGFFALPAVAVNMLDPRTKTRTQTQGMETETSSSPWYETYKRVHSQLMPYVRILRTTSSTSTSSSQEGGGGNSTKTNLTPTQTLSLLFPQTSSHSPDSPVPGPLPLVDQATVLARLVLLLTPLIEPCADWAWLRRVLVGGGGVVDRWDGGCLSGFEGLERRVRSSGGGTGGPGGGSGAGAGVAAGSAVDEKLVQEMRRVAGASWKVYTSMARSKALSSPSNSRSRFRSNGSGSGKGTGTGTGTGISFTAGLGGWGGIGGTDADEAGWELGRVWVEKREVFYESGSGGKWDSGENIVKLPAAKGEPATHTLDFTPMSAVFMERMLTRIREDCGEALRIFGTGTGGVADGGAGASVVKRFVDRLVGEVISEYVSSLLSLTRLLSQDLFLTATAATFVQVWRVVDVAKEVVRQAMSGGKEGDQVEKQAVEAVGKEAERAVYAAFEQHMDEYLEDEVEWIKNVLDKMCKAWDTKMGNATTTQPTQAATFLSSANPDQVKRNVLAGFRDALLLPVTIVPLTVTYGMNAIVTGGTQAVNGLAMLNPQRWTGQSGSDGRGATNGAPAVPVDPVEGAEIDKEKEKAEDLEEVAVQQDEPKDGGEQMQLLLSLDTVLEFVHADRECLKRIETFQGYPSKYGRKVREAIEEVFIHLLRAVAARHIVPACNKAIQQMTNYKPEDSAEGTSNPPLLQYLELVNVVDTVTSILQVYFDKDLAKYIDRTDFLNAAMQEKKRFEGALDDAVAAGMNAGVEVLMNQVEHIIQTRTQPGEYCPSPDQNPELGPTKACVDAITCLEVHCKLLKGSTSKEVLEVFYQEVGLRLQNILQKHIKRQIISLDGGFQMIADLNAYYAFVASLKQPRMAEEFSNLKMLGQVYIVADAKDLAQIIRDVTRYGGTYRPEDLYEFIQRRADWKKIEKTVDNSMYSLSVKEDCIIM